MKLPPLAIAAFLFAPALWAASSAEDLPEPAQADQPGEGLQARVSKFVRQKHGSAAERAKLETRLGKYLRFLALGAAENDKLLERLGDASLKYLLCDDLEDWACLESSTSIQPGAAFRRDALPGLGDAVHAGASLDMDFFFTRRWDNFDPGARNAELTVEKALASRLRADGTRSIQFALYGIDDTRGSMKDVFNALLDARKSGVAVSGVVDSEAYDNLAKGKLAKILERPTKLSSEEYQTLFSHAYDASRVPEGKLWFFDPKYAVAMFQYPGTADLVRALDEGSTSDEQASVKVEWPPEDSIMHNKFFVLENTEGHQAVWTGTTNISQSCMGTEDNANMAVYLRNDVIAEKAFLPEMAEMSSGLFHTKKKPNTNRYFVFDDGTEVRVHFSPTDDAEHRAILPALLSARAGDQIRVAMFGNGGIEYVRAFQLAIARGADVTLVVDRAQGNVESAWLKDLPFNLTQASPYAIPGQVPGKLQFYFSTWKGLNHHKTATITRRQPDGSMLAEILLVGSQNWSAKGNDENDENMLSIRNRVSGVPAAQAFNEEFDSRILPAARDHAKPTSKRD